MDKIILTLPKPLLFALTAAVGCFVFALLAELFLLATHRTPQVKPQSICLTIDVSGSMKDGSSGSKLSEVKKAAKKCIEMGDLSIDQFALVTFNNNASVDVPFAHNKQQLFNAIDSLSADGGTSFNEAMQSSQQALAAAVNERSLILFTDGQTTDSNPQQAAKTASTLRSQGVKVYAIGTNDADRAFLAGLTGDSSLVFSASSGDFVSVFGKVMEIIKGDLINKGGGEYTFWETVFRIGIWTAFLCFGIAFALNMMQHRLLHKPLTTITQIIFLFILTCITGVIAGGIGQVLFSAFNATGFSNGDVAGRVVGWTLLGLILAYGMGLFIPNFNKDWAIKAGAVGGLLAVIAFLYISTRTGDVGGRIFGAVILGMCIGLLVGFVEAVAKDAWLTIYYSANEKARVNLGAEPVSIGSGRSDTVFVSGVGESKVVFRLANGQIYYKQNGSEHCVASGYELMLGNTKVTVERK
ncbi:MAG: VWA domain-containing protein [Planctomycetaceae bacterium]|jgi:Ca-activated chloride channel family protein|nr:VWA domain-containing protein [Planctomycetaceae bacterium]